MKKSYGIIAAGAAYPVVAQIAIWVAVILFGVLRRSLLLTSISLFLILAVAATVHFVLQNHFRHSPPFLVAAVIGYLLSAGAFIWISYTVSATILLLYLFFLIFVSIAWAVFFVVDLIWLVVRRIHRNTPD